MNDRINASDINDLKDTLFGEASSSLVNNKSMDMYFNFFEELTDVLDPLMNLHGVPSIDISIQKSTDERGAYKATIAPGRRSVG